MHEESDLERIKRLQLLCDQLEALRKQAEKICKNVTTELRRAELAGQRERRSKSQRVQSERRRKV